MIDKVYQNFRRWRGCGSYSRRKTWTSTMTRRYHCWQAEAMFDDVYETLRRRVAVMPAVKSTFGL